MGFLDLLRGLSMNKVRFLFKKALTPVTIMVIPHDNLRSLNIKIPAIKIFFTMLLNAIGASIYFHFSRMP